MDRSLGHFSHASGRPVFDLRVLLMFPVMSSLMIWGNSYLGSSRIN